MNDLTSYKTATAVLGVFSPTKLDSAIISRMKDIHATEEIKRSTLDAPRAGFGGPSVV